MPHEVDVEATEYLGPLDGPVKEQTSDWQHEQSSRRMKNDNFVRRVYTSPTKRGEEARSTIGLTWLNHTSPMRRVSDCVWPHLVLVRGERGVAVNAVV